MIICLIIRLSLVHVEFGATMQCRDYKPEVTQVIRMVVHYF